MDAIGPVLGSFTRKFHNVTGHSSFVRIRASTRANPLLQRGLSRNHSSENLKSEYPTRISEWRTLEHRCLTEKWPLFNILLCRFDSFLLLFDSGVSAKKDVASFSNFRLQGRGKLCPYPVYLSNTFLLRPNILLSSEILVGYSDFQSLPVQRDHASRFTPSPLSL